MTVSTAGYVNGIRRMADEKRKCKLAISLHATEDATRARLMPIAKKHALAELLSAVEYYYAHTEQRVTFEYILFHGVNDSPEDAARLIKITRRVPSKINLIPFHSIDFMQPAGFGRSLHPVSLEKMEEFASRLREGNATVMIRGSAGQDIEAACGQLAVAGIKKGRAGR